MTKIFVFEYLTGGGIDPALAGAGSLADLSALIVEGRVMRDALVADLREIDGVQVSFATSRFETVDPALAHCMAAPGESMTSCGDAAQSGLRADPWSCRAQMGHVGVRDRWWLPSTDRPPGRESAVLLRA